ncbi:MBL fold metallo-hydrolase [Paracoccus pacificus]|uniref:MBL fold metallo-hydrolase n=1 Tax=Paracoccus pacificus TaxID=1463598 RepID=A0ABW4R5K7_9RHOB
MKMQRLIAPNPGPLTGTGTNTYLLGDGDALALIDPGPDDSRHRAAIIAALRPGQRISHIFVTHPHRDHSEGATALATATGAQVLAFGTPDSGRSAAMRRLAAQGPLGGSEGVDAGFRPDQSLTDGQIVTGEDWQLTALHTPGHFGAHLCFAHPGAQGPEVFSGDLVMGWATTLISPPDGDLLDFFRSLDRLAGLAAARLHPGHGEPVTEVAARLDALARHRRARTGQIMRALDDGPASAAELAARIYTDLPPALLPAATRNVLAHLLALADLGAVTARGPIAADAIFERS